MINCLYYLLNFEFKLNNDKVSITQNYLMATKTKRFKALDF